MADKGLEDIEQSKYLISLSIDTRRADADVRRRCLTYPP